MGDEGENKPYALLVCLNLGGRGRISEASRALGGNLEHDDLTVRRKAQEPIKPVSPAAAAQPAGVCLLWLPGEPPLEDMRTWVQVRHINLQRVVDDQ